MIDLNRRVCAAKYDDPALCDRNITFFANVISPSRPEIVSSGGRVEVSQVSPGLWQALSYDAVTRVAFGEAGAADITSVLLKKATTLTSMNTMFFPSPSSPMSSLTDVYFFPQFDTSNVTDFSAMLYATAVTYVDISSFYLASAVNMNRMLAQNANLASVAMPLDMLNTPPAADMSYMFDGDYSLTCITLLDTTAATDRTDIFSGCSALTAPDSTAQADLTDADGAQWTNPGACP